MRLTRYSSAAIFIATLLPALLLRQTKVAADVPAGQPTERQQDDAKKHFEQGVALFEEGNFDGALAELKAARSLGGGPAVLYNLGLTYQALFRYAEAADALREYLVVAEQARKLDASRKTAVLQLIDEMEALLGKVIVDLVPEHAQLLVDGRPVPGVRGKPLRLASGTHFLEATAPGFLPERREIVVAGGQTVEAVLHLQPMPTKQTEPSAVLPEKGRLRLASDAHDTHVVLDQVSLGTAPVDVEVQSGQHLLELFQAQHYHKRLVILVEPRRTLSVDVAAGPRKFNPDERPDSVMGTWWFWGIVGGGAALVGAALLAIASGG